MLPLVNPSFQALARYTTAKPAPGCVRPVARLASNENPCGPSALVAQALADPSALNLYPDPGSMQLRSALAGRLSVDTDQIMIGNGANEVLDMIARTFLGPGENTVYADPSFIVFKLAPLAMGAEVREVPLRGDRYDLEGMLAAVDDHTKLIYLANPSNPTGAYIRQGELDDFVARLPPHVLLVVDEAYREYAVARDFPDATAYLGRRERLIVVRTFSKCYGLAAMRVGYAIASAEIVDYLNRGRQPFNVNALAQRAACAALSDDMHVERSRQQNRTQMATLVRGLSRLGCRVSPSQGNFLMVDLLQPAGPIVDALAEQGVMVRGMACYGRPTSVRITVGRPEDIRLLLTALRPLLKRVQAAS